MVHSRADHPFWRFEALERRRCLALLQPVSVAELLLTMGQLNRLLTCVVTAMTGYLGAYSAHAELGGLARSPGSPGRFAQDVRYPFSAGPCKRVICWLR
jgi:hypothetical protein